MNVFIVHAHPEAKSFNRTLLDRSVTVLQDIGHTVVVSDLYAMGFNPVASADDFEQRRFPDQLQYDREQKHSHANHSFAQDIQLEIDKLIACDLLILQFPLWWFSVPAILKGWIDRVFINGLAYGKGKRFDTGGMKGKKAMICTSTACLPEMVEPDGLLAALDINLWHLQHGTLGYAGFEVLPPFAAWSVHYTTPEARAQYLDDYEIRLRNLHQTAAMPMHRLEEFGPDWRLKQGIQPRTVGHRRI